MATMPNINRLFRYCGGSYTATNGVTSCTAACPQPSSKANRVGLLQLLGKLLMLSSLCFKLYMDGTMDRMELAPLY